MRFQERFEKDAAAADAKSIKHHATAVLVMNDTRFLLVQRTDDDFRGGQWELPGGKREDGESIIACAQRELLEETGLDIDELIAYVSSFEYPSRAGGMTRQFTFLSTACPGDVILSEHQDFAWVTPEELKNYPVSNEIAATIRQGIEIWNENN